LVAAPEGGVMGLSHLMLTLLGLLLAVPAVVLARREGAAPATA